MTPTRDWSSWRNSSAISEAFENARTVLLSRQSQTKVPWPDSYINSETSQFYEPHHKAEREWVNDFERRYLLAKGGEGGGKSVAGIIRDLERIRAGAHGILVSPD